jgi:hypothetical protein
MLALRPSTAGAPDHGGYGRIRAAFVRAFDADPRGELDALAQAAIARAKEGDTAALSFIRDTLDGKPIQRTDAVIAHQSNRAGDEMTDEELAARIAELEARLAVLDQDDEAANDGENAGTAH